MKQFLSFIIFIAILTGLTACSSEPSIDTTPDTFSFVDQTDITLNTLTESAAITISGINTMVTISVENGEYSIDGGAYTNSEGVVTNGQSVSVRHTSSANYNTSVDTVLTIGNVSDIFTTVSVIEVVHINMSGKVEYQDKVYDPNGFIAGNEPLKPVRYALLDLTDLQGNILLSTTTDNSGNYQLSGMLYVGQYNIRVLSQTDVTSGYDVTINNLSSEIYAATKTISVLIDGALTENITIDLSSEVSGAFNMLDVFTTGMEFVDYHSPGQQWLTPLNVYWQYNSSTLTSTYHCNGFEQTTCPQGAGVYVLSASSSNSDSDEYDDDVLWHEFGHYLEFSQGQVDSPGGYHTLSDSTQDLRLTWSEGHSNYLQAAIKTWLQNTNTFRLSTPPALSSNYYVDTSGATVGVSINFGDLCVDCFLYSSNEAAVANVLIGLKDYSGIQANWDVLTTYLNSNLTADTLESFWEGFLLQQTDIQTNVPLYNQADWDQWQSVLFLRSINYKLDSFEFDDVFNDTNIRTIDCTAVGVGKCLDAEEHYLYKGPELNDNDVIELNLTAGSSYYFYTHALKNGADTLIRLYDDSFTQIAINDEINPSNTSTAHNGFNFASEIFYTPITSGIYYLSVETAPDVYDDVTGFGYIGRFGTYSLTIEVN